MLPYAIKELDGNGAQYATACQKEINNLTRFCDTDQDYLIELLFAYIHRGRYHLAFPWANGNLRSLWRDKYPDPATPKRNEGLAKWVFRQSYRLVEGLKLIHGYEVKGRLTGERHAPHGTHGDLKPENILFFKSPSDSEDTSDLDQLKISDLGGAQFHSVLSKSHVPINGLHTTGAYQAPEAAASEEVAQSYDFWSLGCVLLEFMTWYLQGWKGVEEFSQSRTADYDPMINTTAEGGFFLTRYLEVQKDKWNYPFLEDSFFHRRTHRTNQHGFLARNKRSVHNVSLTLRYLVGITHETLTELIGSILTYFTMIPDGRSSRTNFSKLSRTASCV